MIDDSRGMTPERKKYIQNHRKQADIYGNSLPYEIGKPKKGRPRNVVIECPKCQHVIFVSKVTSCVICSCGEFINLED